MSLRIDRIFSRGANSFIVNLTVAIPDPAGTLPKACHAGLIDMEGVIEDFT
jgi:hypothetical protein